MAKTLKGTALAAALALAAIVGTAPAVRAERFIPVAVGGGTTVK